ncbi:MAG: SMODS domain-containing nucleotidyltransferase [Planctomycetota bacterium]|jgi:hypothetical protein
MPRTIEEGFRDFNDKLKMVKTESDAVKSHRASIESCLEGNFEMYRFFRTGSIGSGTNINGYSDTDYFAVIPKKNLTKNSTSTLTKIKVALQHRFPRTSNIHIDGPAVVIPFGTAKSDTTEIIPVDYIKTKNSANIYDMPNGAGGWMKSSPKAHNNYVTNINSKLSYKVKPLVRFIKAWKFYRNAPIISFYLEMRVAKYASQEKSISYSIDIKNILKQLLDIKLAPMKDPNIVSGYIHPCSSEAQKKDALSKLETAYTRAKYAWEAEDKGDIKEAFEWWDKLFYHEFPSFL